MANSTELICFEVDRNQLSGPVSPPDGLVNLNGFDVAYNQLPGSAPALFQPNALVPGFSSLCPNMLMPSDDPGWDLATGASPWFAACEFIFIDGFDGPPN
ncbi:MAG: hypothetical protein ABI843_08425 [Dokdonella sp.]